MIPPGLLVVSSEMGRPPTYWHAEACHLPTKGLPIHHISIRERPRLPFTARIGRAQFHRARSASKEGTWSLSPHPSEAAR